MEAKKRPTVADRVLDQLKTMIVRGDLKPGQRLPAERELAERLTVARTSLREALKVLSHLGLVERSQGGTVVVRDLGQVLNEPLKYRILQQRLDRQELLEARKVLEAELASLAAMRRTDDDIDNMQDIIERGGKSMDCAPAEFVKLDFEFHLAIAESTQNKVLTEMFDTVRQLLYDTHIRVCEIPGIVQRSHNFHRHIFAAVKDGDPMTARSRMIQHIEETSMTLAKYGLI